MSGKLLALRSVGRLDVEAAYMDPLLRTVSGRDGTHSLFPFLAITSSALCRLGLSLRVWVFLSGPHCDPEAEALSVH
jgi:hypothetical protein